ncbi:MAG: ComF family protein [Gallionella sp.]|nr:ComF family protein [Gallionella sp.]
MSILRDRWLNICLKLQRILPAQPCVLCGDMSHHGLWCAACEADLPYLGAGHCPVCALPTTQGEVCGQCLKTPPIFTRTTAVFAYHYPLNKLIQQMKYAEQLPLAHAFALQLARKINLTERPDYVIAMPLHPTRLRERGFNQSLLLAQSIAYTHQLKLLPTACQRIRATEPQTSLPRDQRAKNMRGAFQCDQDLTGRRIALVDDVLTTGASLNALAAAVQARGATQIEAWVVARTLGG